MKLHELIHTLAEALAKNPDAEVDVEVPGDVLFEGSMNTDVEADIDELGNVHLVPIL